MRKTLDDAKFHFIRPEKKEEQKEKTTFIDSKNTINKNDGKQVEFHYKENGELTTDTIGSYCMKRVYKNGVNEYFVKFATAGAGVGRMLNPWGVYYKLGDEFKYEKYMGRMTYEFRKVSELVFDTYIHFLKTKNERHILVAERELLNG